MKVAVLCEFSGIVRDSFIKLGHEAISCDLLPTESPGPHIQGDCLEYDWSSYNLVICHPPCTYLASSGARWFAYRYKQQDEALNFVNKLLNLPVHRIALENPVGVISTKIRLSDQIIQPWQFGHGETKTTCLWLKNLPKLIPTNIVDGRSARVHNMSDHKNRWKDRSRTYIGIAEAMAQQWGSI